MLPGGGVGVFVGLEVREGTGVNVGSMLGQGVAVGQACTVASWSGFNVAPICGPGVLGRGVFARYTSPPSRVRWIEIASVAREGVFPAEVMIIALADAKIEDHPSSY